MSPVVTPGKGETVEQVTRTRILNGNEKGEKFSSDSLEYMESFTPEEWAKGEHTIYLYREEPPVFKGSGPAYVTKYASPINLESIQREYGGGVWRIVIKRGSERVCDRNYTVGGLPLDLTRTMQGGAVPTGLAAAANGNGNGAVHGDSNTSKLIDAATNVDAQKAQVDMVKSTAEQMIQLARESAPKQTSMAEMIELAQKLQAINGGGKASFWANPLVISLVSALGAKLIDRLFVDDTGKILQLFELYQKMNGGANVAGDWKLAAAQAVPKVAESLADALHEMRMGAEVQAGVRTPESEVVMRAGQAPNANTQPAGAPAAAQPNPKVIEMQPPAAHGDPMEAFEKKFVELLANPQISGAQAAEILWQDWPNIMAEIAQYPPELIMANAFKRPILAPHAANPRAPQFVADLIAWVKARPKGA